MTITNPAATRFLNETLRPLAEARRAYLAEVQSVRQAYDSGIGDLFWGHGDEMIDDGRTDGAPVLTGNDVLAFVAQCLDAEKAAMEANNGPTTVAALCVRPLRAE